MEKGPLNSKSPIPEHSSPTRSLSPLQPAATAASEGVKGYGTTKYPMFAYLISYFWNKSSMVTILSKREAYSFRFRPYVVTSTDMTVFFFPTISWTCSIRSRRVLL